MFDPSVAAISTPTCCFGPRGGGRGLHGAAGRTKTREIGDVGMKITRRAFAKSPRRARHPVRRAWALDASKSINVGIYTAQQGEYVRKQIVPKFEADYNCRVFTTEGVDPDADRRLRATRNPKYSAMFMTTSVSTWPRRRAARSAAGGQNPQPAARLQALPVQRGLRRRLRHLQAGFTSIRRNEPRSPATAICGRTVSPSGC